MDKEEFLEKALRANEEAVGQSKLSDLTNKDSTYYKGPDVPQEEQSSISEDVQKIDPDAIPQLRTLKGDFEGAVKEDNLSVARMVLAESKKKERSGQQTDRPKKSAFEIISTTLAIMLILGGIGSISYVLFIKNKGKDKTISTFVTKKTLVRFDDETTIPLDKLNKITFKNKIEKELKNPPAEDHIRHIKITESSEVAEPASIIGWLKNIEAKTPEDLLRFLKRDFFVGINFINGKGESFMIITGENYENLYPGILAWEKTLVEDLESVFQNQSNASSTTLYSFKDRVIANKDVRVSTDKEGNVHFFYSIVDDTTVIFAESQTTFEEVLKRMRERKAER